LFDSFAGAPSAVRGSRRKLVVLAKIRRACDLICIRRTVACAVGALDMVELQPKNSARNSRMD
jgi:hypothetical protein